VRVVQQHHHRPGRGQVAEQHGQPLKQPGPRLLALRLAAADGRHAAQQHRQVVQEARAQPGDPLGVQAPQVPLERLGPEAERGGRPGAVGARRQAQHAVALGQLPGQARLAEARLAQQHHAAEFPGPGPVQLGREQRQLRLAADQPRDTRQRHRTTPP
jgi:hypothetical protein